MTYKSSFQVPAPAVVHEADKTSPQEVPQQDGDVHYQHVGHRQPHEFLKGGTQRQGGQGWTLFTSPDRLQPCQISPHTRILLWDPLIFGGRVVAVQSKNPRLWNMLKIGLSFTSY